MLFGFQEAVWQFKTLKKSKSGENHPRTIFNTYAPSKYAKKYKGQVQNRIGFGVF